jgi:hypothetical protein
MEPIQMPELVPDFLPGQMVYTIIDGLIYRVMIIKVHITLSLDPSVGFLYYVLADKLAGDRSVVSTTEVFPTKTDLIDWLMDNVQNEGAS